MTTKKSQSRAVEGTNNTRDGEGTAIISGPSTNEAAAKDPQGKGAYGVVHVMEEEMKAAGVGVFGDAKG